MGYYWACARTHPCREKLATINLRRQKFIAFFPFFLTQTKRGRTVPQAAFPGYVFVKLVDGEINWAPINFTLGVAHLLTQRTADDDAYRLPCRADFVDGLHKMRIFAMDRPGHDEPDLIPPGTIIKITQGPFVNRQALVRMSSAQRVHVLLQAFNREVVVECEVEAVERVA